jgi:hypothetical protein
MMQCYCTCILNSFIAVFTPLNVGPCMHNIVMVMTDELMTVVVLELLNY